MPLFSLGRSVGSGEGEGGGGGLPQAQVDARIASFAASFAQTGLKGNSYYDYADRTIVALCR